MIVPLTILYEDQELLVVDKPSGLLVHPSREAADKDTLLSRARNYTGAWVYPVNRIDRGASGIVVLGKSSEAAANWQSVWHQDSCIKKYLVLLHGVMTEMVISERPLTDDNGQQQAAHTMFQPLAACDAYQVTLVQATIATGRRHQIRRHAAHLGHHVLGDRKFGKAKWNNTLRDAAGLGRMFLHASCLSAVSSSGKPLAIFAPLSIDLQPCLELLGLQPVWREWEKQQCISQRQMASK